MITLKEVYDQLTKEELGTERARVVINYNDAFHDSIVCGDDSGTVVLAMPNEGYRGFSYNWEVEWIGDQPKTRLMAPAIIRVKAGTWKRPQQSDELYESLEEANADL